ncbi:MAG: amidohydrolase family protein [Clostridia bacterium]|nr:amidohydrolase family protein [Clostridia bacterium]
MKKFDMHTHLAYAEGDADIIERLDAAGLYGACVISAPPVEHKSHNGVPFEERLAGILDYVSRAGDRLYPILWVHPDEENVLRNVEIAAERGIAGFKMICNSYYVYEEKSMALLRKIASLNKPVLFHTGILWDGRFSSDYNRPLNFEALIDIEGLRFSMGHCSWPWIDECIALYGKFLNARLGRNTAEMYLDITPGTPEIYREELLTKLFTIGYDVGGHLLFGTDCFVENYNSDWAKKWLDTDRRIMDKLGVSKACREGLYHNNLMNFLGISKSESEIKAPNFDNANAWSPVNGKVREIIEGWYKRLGFDRCYDRDFYRALEEIKVSDAVNIREYDKGSEDGMRNLLSFLYMCEGVADKYREMGIPDDILVDTLYDIVLWTRSWSKVKGRTYLGELGWLTNHMTGRLHKLGRLQFCRGRCEMDVPELGIREGEPIIEIHIPARGPLTREECENSIAMAKEFYAKYYPDYDYKCFTCSSWLMDQTLKELLPAESNIIRFQDMFTVLDGHESYSLLKYLFGWDTRRENLAEREPTSSFARKVKERVMQGGKFYSAFGYIKK